MSVIVTGLDVAEDCDIAYAHINFCDNKHGVVDYETLDITSFKSAEGLLEKIEHCIDGMVANNSVMSGAISTKNKIVEIIKEYCEIEG